MKLDRVTITGADNSVSAKSLLDLSAAFPFVEWGILVSAKQMGAPRFPTIQWVEMLQALVAAQEGEVRLSLHVCGYWVRAFMVGAIEMPLHLLGSFQRMQLNFHGESILFEPEKCVHALAGTGVPQIIFQIDGNQGQTMLAAVSDGRQSFECVPLFDVSHGAGVLPYAWPKPLDPDTYQGYAGGLGPDNLERQLDLIAEAAGDTPIWIDMETRVRSDDDQRFDLDKVVRCLEIAKPFVRHAQP